MALSKSNIEQCIIFGLIINIALFLFAGPVSAAFHTAASCSMADVQAAITNASAGDIVLIPAGAAIWGDGGSYLSVNKQITVQGAGQGQTIITLSDSGGRYGNGTIRISAAATVRSMTINGSNAGPVCAFSTSTSNDWRITDIDYNGGAAGAYFAYVGNVYGLIDSNDITGGVGNAELIFVRGPSNSWQTPHSIGSSDNLFIEDNTFNGQGYVCDINSDGRAVLRFNTITGPMKIDGHGKASNTPPRGVRHMEVYNNIWTYSGPYWAALEIRGGGGRVFDNTIASSATIWVILTEYAATSTWPNFGNICQCPANYPIDDQIGVGMDPKVGGSEPLYLWGNTKGGANWVLTWKAPSSACVQTCGTFSVSEIIKEGREYFMSETKPAAMSGYMPYTYPHPLRTVQPVQQPQLIPPQRLRLN